MQDEKVSIEIRERHTGRRRELDVGRVVNCTGPNCNIVKIKDSLIAVAKDTERVTPLRGAGLIV